MNLPVNISIESESAIVLQMPSLKALAAPRQADSTEEMKPRMKIQSFDTIVCYHVLSSSHHLLSTVGSFSSFHKPSALYLFNGHLDIK